MKTPPTVLVMYHYLYPDEVVSSIHLTDLCTGLAAKGWRVIGSSCNRGARDESKVYRPCSWKGVEFRKSWRPNLRQASAIGRLANAVWMIGAWSLTALNPSIRPDVVIIGTDPVLSPLVALVWRTFRPKVKIAHWCFDLYPEAAVAAGIMAEESLLVRGIKKMLRGAYRRFDLIADIGECMRGLLQKYGSKARQLTITPWALTEPAEPAPIDLAERQELFGEVSIGLLYSGTFGRAHSWHGVPELAEELRQAGGKIAFSVQGNAVDELRHAVAASGAAISFHGFAPSHLLARRLCAADVHIVSLREEWTGTVVPSKFFGALAIGRPVLFLGSRGSAIARWIEEFNVGWVLDGSNNNAIVQKMVEELSAAEKKVLLFKRCHAAYFQSFSLAKGLERWDRGLRGLF